MLHGLRTSSKTMEGHPKPTNVRLPDCGKTIEIVEFISWTLDSGMTLPLLSPCGAISNCMVDMIDTIDHKSALLQSHLSNDNQDKWFAPIFGGLPWSTGKSPMERMAWEGARTWGSNKLIDDYVNLCDSSIAAFNTL